jgi:hypothetical protein
LVEKRSPGTLTARGQVGDSQFGPVLFSGNRALYLFTRNPRMHDPRGQVLCNDVFEFGGAWFAVNANGRRPS